MSDTDESLPAIVFTLTYAELQALSPCDIDQYWWGSPRLETINGVTMLVYREGWRETMARFSPGALLWLGKKKLGGLDERTARELITFMRAHPLPEDQP